MSETAPILVVDDDPNIIRLIGETLALHRLPVIGAGSGRQALELLERQPVQLAILDMQLPDTYGIQLFQQIRSRYPELGCLFVSGVDQEMEIVLGLELGAEDYITKPFRPRELLTRVTRALGRTRPPAPEAGAALLRFGELSLDAGRRSVELSGRSIPLTKAEFDLLWLLASQAGQVFSRRQILERLWADELDVSERIVDTHIRHLRAKIEAQPARPRWLQTSRGIGYCFKTPG